MDLGVVNPEQTHMIYLFVYLFTWLYTLYCALVLQIKTFLPVFFQIDLAAPGICFFVYHSTKKSPLGILLFQINGIKGRLDTC